MSVSIKLPTFNARDSVTPRTPGAKAEAREALLQVRENFVNATNELLQIKYHHEQKNYIYAYEVLRAYLYNHRSKQYSGISEARRNLQIYFKTKYHYEWDTNTLDSIIEIAEKQINAIIEDITAITDAFKGWAAIRSISNAILKLNHEKETLTKLRLVLHNIRISRSPSDRDPTTADTALHNPYAFKATEQYFTKLQWGGIVQDTLHHQNIEEDNRTFEGEGYNHRISTAVSEVKEELDTIIAKL